MKQEKSPDKPNTEGYVRICKDCGGEMPWHWGGPITNFKCEKCGRVEPCASIEIDRSKNTVTIEEGNKKKVLEYPRGDFEKVLAMSLGATEKEINHTTAITDEHVAASQFIKSLKDVDWNDPLPHPVELPSYFEQVNRELKETGNKVVFCFNKVMTKERAQQHINHIKQFCATNSFSVSEVECGNPLKNPYEQEQPIDNSRLNKVVLTLIPKPPQ